MGGTMIVGQGTTKDDALADYEQEAKKAEEMGLYPDDEPEIVQEHGQYLAIGHAHT